jgi:hypothetical protein
MEGLVSPVYMTLMKGKIMDTQLSVLSSFGISTNDEEWIFINSNGY